MKIEQLYFDLDGTILDAKKRLYLLFLHIVPECKLTFFEYWELKKDMKSHGYILEYMYNYDKKSIEKFNQIWLKKIELKKWLQRDTIIEGSNFLLNRLSKRYELYLITSRQSIDNTLWQLKKLKLSQFFSEIIVVSSNSSKYEELRSRNCSVNSLIIGDTGIETEAGKKLNMKTVSVLSGFRNERSLKKYSPDYIINSILEIENILNSTNYECPIP